MDKPNALQVETGNYCNSHCTFCPVPKLRRARGFMSDELYRKIVDDAAANLPKLDRFLPFLNGEPFLDPKMLERVAYANEKIPKTQIHIYTNGTLLTPELVDKFKTVRIDQLVLSLNADTPETYKKLMGLDFEDTVKKIDYLVKNKPANMKITISVIEWLVPKIEVFGMLTRWKDKADIISVPLKNWAGDDRVPQVSEYAMTNPCWRLEQFFVLWDGKVCLCCMDAEGQEIMGDMNTQTILEVFNTKKYQDYRVLHRTRRRNELPLCKNCSTA